MYEYWGGGENRTITRTSGHWDGGCWWEHWRPRWCRPHCMQYPCRKTAKAECRALSPDDLSDSIKCLLVEFVNFLRSEHGIIQKFVRGWTLCCDNHSIDGLYSQTGSGVSDRFHGIFHLVEAPWGVSEENRTLKNAKRKRPASHKMVDAMIDSMKAMHWINPSINQSIEQSINQSIHITINQSIDHCTVSTWLI